MVATRIRITVVNGHLDLSSGVKVIHEVHAVPDQFGDGSSPSGFQTNLHSPIVEIEAGTFAVRANLLRGSRQHVGGIFHGVKDVAGREQESKSPTSDANS